MSADLHPLFDPRSWPTNLNKRDFEDRNTENLRSIAKTLTQKKG